MGTSETGGQVPSYVFVLLDRIDESGQPRTNALAKSWIRADAAKKWRAQQAENKAQAIRQSTLNIANIFFGSEFDAFKTLPTLPIESTNASSLDGLKAYTLQCFTQHHIKSTLLPAAYKSPSLFASMLLLAAASMTGSRITGGPGPEILALRQEALSLVRQQLASPDTSGAAEHTLAIQCLAGASFAYGFEPDVNFVVHVNALSNLLRLRGKSKYMKTNIGRNVLNGLVMSVTLKGFESDSFVLELTIFRTNYTSWVTLGIPVDPFIGNADLVTGRAGRSLRSADWVSPLFWPEPHAVLLDKFRSSCDEKLWQLIQVAHELTELVSEAPDVAITKLKALRRFIEDLPKGERTDYSQVRSAQVHRYESCRLTAILMTRVASRGETWSDAASGTTFENDIIFSLSNSDTGELWGEHVGLLYWVSLVAYAVLHKTRYRIFGAGLVHRLISEISYGDQDPLIGIHSLKRLGKFEEAWRTGIGDSPRATD